MYQEHFGLTRELFRSNAEGESIYVGPQQLATIARLRKALATPDAVVAVTGPVGVGKSVIAGRALEEIAPERMIARIGRMRLGPDEVLELLLESFSVTRQPAGTIQRFAAFKRLLRDFAANGTRPFIVVEDARRVGTDALLEIEALTAADTSGVAAANIILLGDGELDTLLADPGLARLKQRIRLRHTVTPFTESDTEGYLRRCVSLAGGDFGSMFASGTVAALHACAGGIPRVLNNICESVLTEAADRGERPVTAVLVSTVASDVYGIEVMPGFAESSADDADEENTDSVPDVGETALASSLPAESGDASSDTAPDTYTAEDGGEYGEPNTAVGESTSAVEAAACAGGPQPEKDTADAEDRTEVAPETDNAPVDELAERRLASSSQPVRSHQDLPELGELLARIGATRPQAGTQPALEEYLPDTSPETAVDGAPEQAATDANLVESDAVTEAFEPESAELTNVDTADEETVVAGSLPEAEAAVESESESAVEADSEPEAEFEAAAEAPVEAEAEAEAEAESEPEFEGAAEVVAGPDTAEAAEYRDVTADPDDVGSQMAADNGMPELLNNAEGEASIKHDIDEETVSPDATVEASTETSPVSDDEMQEPVHVADDDDTLEAPILDEQELPSLDEVLAAPEVPDRDWSASDDDIPVLTAEMHVAAANDEEDEISLTDTPDEQASASHADDVMPDIAVADIDELELALSVTNDVIEESPELPEITLDNQLDKKKASAPASNLSRWQEELALANGLEDISDVLAETVFGDKAFDELAARIASSPDPDQLDGLALAVESSPAAPVSSAAAPAADAPATTSQQDRSGAWKFDMSVSRRFELVKELGRAQKEREINAHSMVEITLGEDGYPVDASQGPVPEPIEMQIDTEITQSRMALKQVDIDKLAAEEEPPPEPEKESRGLFGLFRRSSRS